MDSETTINMFVNPNMITNRQTAEIPINFLTNAGAKIVNRVRNFSGAGQTKFHPDMIANVLSLTEMTKQYQVTLTSGYENDFRVHIDC